MKILFLPAYFYPEDVASSFLGWNTKDAYASKGWNMELFVSTPSRGITKEQRKKYKDMKREVMYEGKLTVHRFSMFAEGRNPILRVLRYFFCSCKQFNRAIFCAKGIDVMFIASTPPIQGALGALIKKCKGYPFVYNLQDIFPDSLVSSGLAKEGGLLWKIGRVIENFTYRNADKIIVISEDFKKNIMAKGVPEEKIEVIYNWVDENAVVPIAKEENPLYKEFDINPDKFNVVYAGNLGAAQNIDIILAAAERTRGISDVEYLIFGSEQQSGPYIKKLKDRALTNVKILPIQPYERVSYVYSLGDVAIVPCKKGFGSIGMPSKTWSIMSAGTAVLASFDGGTDMQRIIESNKVGLFTEAEDLDAFTQAIMTLYEDRKECIEMGERGRQFIQNNLTREIGTSKYVAVLNSVVKGC